MQSLAIIGYETKKALASRKSDNNNNTTTNNNNNYYYYKSNVRDHWRPVSGSRNPISACVRDEQSVWW